MHLTDRREDRNIPVKLPLLGARFGVGYFRLRKFARERPFTVPIGDNAIGDPRLQVQSFHHENVAGLCPLNLQRPRHNMEGFTV
jgi:hypothetical protein